jgi:DNA-binding transcriptional ArsR family regulator
MDRERTAADVFGLLADDTRLDILRTVAEAQHERRETGVANLSFSEIYDRVDVDGTSKLSYHLGELTGTFLRKHDDGYAFTHAGERLVRFVLAENYRQPTDFGTVATDGTCLHCGEPGLEAALHEQFLMLRCQACERLNFTYRATPALLRAHADGALIDAVTWELAGDLLKMRQGVCPDCAGRMETAILDADDVESGDAVPASFATSSECQQCLRFMSLPLPHAVAYHPESVAFHWEHGVDIVGTGMWELHRHLHDGRWSAERVATEPAEYRVEMRRADTSLRLYLDETAAVTRTERVQRRGGSDRRA